MKPAPSRFRIRPSGLARLPRAAPGMRIGLYGGSFNPAHAGHRHVSLMALKRLGLDRVWWIVTPGNPLKDPANWPRRRCACAEARQVSDDPRIDVTAFEEEIGARYTVDTLAYLKRRYPGCPLRLDHGRGQPGELPSLAGLARIARMMPIAVIDRPGWTLKAVRSQSAIALSPQPDPGSRARALPDLAPPAWVFLHGPRSHLSSTAAAPDATNFCYRKTLKIGAFPHYLKDRHP